MLLVKHMNRLDRLFFQLLDNLLVLLAVSAPLRPDKLIEFAGGFAHLCTRIRKIHGARLAHLLRTVFILIGGLDIDALHDSEFASIGDLAHDLFHFGEILLSMAADLLCGTRTDVLLNAPVVGAAEELDGLDEA